ncbi:MAG: glycosyltransferase family 2 protein [Oliverpabstia sp.]
MQKELFEVERERFDLTNSVLYRLQGIWPKEYTISATLDKKELSVKMKPQEKVSAMDRFKNLELAEGIRVEVEIELLEELKGYQKLSIYGHNGQKKFLWFSIPVKYLIEKQNRPHYYLEEINRELGLNTCSIRGWSVYTQPVQVKVTDLEHKELPCEIQYMNRPDVVEMYDEFDVEVKCGFFIELKRIPVKEFLLIFSAGDVCVEKKISMKREQILLEKAEDYWEKGYRYLKLHGPMELTRKIAGKVKRHRQETIIYSKWLQKHLPSKAELEQQRKTKFDWEPLFSVVVPLYKTPEKYLRALVDSLKQQTYSNWQLCLSDGSGPDSPLRELLDALSREEPRIKVIPHEETLKISENTNAAIQAADGDYIVFADHDDTLTAHALFECAKALNSNRNLEVIYSDEDKMTMDGHKFFQYHFKPDFNIDLLCTVNYICHLFVAKRELIERVGMLRSEYDGAQDYDFIFRCIEDAGVEKIHHIPKILYHWRCHEDSTSENPESKLYAFDAGQRAVQAHYDRIGVKAEVYKGEYLGLYRTRYIRDYDPLISIVIPNKDHIDDLKRCMDSIDQNSTYKNYEYIIVENNSENPETFAYYQQLEAVNPKVHVVYWKGVFNYSAINNFGETYANGEYLLLLNNDTEIINPDCLEELLGYCMREDVGAVGARLYYEDDTIQHAGVVVGFGGIAGHCFVMQKRGYTGYCHRIICAQDYSAVTAACMMVKRKAFNEVGGLSEELQVAFNDIDFCMKLRQAGYLIVYNPYAELYHYESKSRGLEDTPEKVARFNKEIETFAKKWPEILRDGDPYYNPNLTLESQDFSLKRL